MTGRPLLLLDVDGPLNPFRAAFPALRGYTGHRMHPTVWTARRAPGSRSARRGLKVRLHPSHGARLRALPLELVWATTWMHQANTMIAPHIGLPGDLPVIEWPELFARDPDGLYWKTRPLLDWAAGRPFAWVDDMITARDRAWVAAHHPSPALLLRIHPRHGLRDRDFTALTQWAAGISAGGR
ncbi:HAD domain-containing protein [Streptomyces sp. NPDC058662]|uniref:HAD domain-containing protein n=1 Tax=Streptomyces sp. NPDC058662 TaxID=3346583 RepID=UPI00365D646F